VNFSEQAAYPHRTAIGFGSNLGDSQAILEAALKTLASSPGLQLQVASPCYRTLAVGPPQPDYYNLCAQFATDLTPQALLNTLLAVEAQFGRIRRERWGPRLLDLDLLLFEDWVVDQPNLQIPHPRMRERAFVLVPLSDIAPDWLDPVSGQSIAQLRSQIDCFGVTLVHQPVQPPG
jgi:2-amino-4-hydroxy-6-hydroxymethyldihydropteridine diphosphokinase